MVVSEIVRFREATLTHREILYPLHWLLTFASGKTILNRVFLFLKLSAKKKILSEESLNTDNYGLWCEAINRASQQTRHRALDPPLTIGDKYFLTAMAPDQNIEAGRDNKHSPSCLHPPYWAQGCQMRLVTSSNVLTIDNTWGAGAKDKRYPLSIIFTDAL